jgi:hypothetical protein
MAKKELLVKYHHIWIPIVKRQFNTQKMTAWSPEFKSQSHQKQITKTLIQHVIQISKEQNYEDKVLSSQKIILECVADPNQGSINLMPAYPPSQKK